MSLFWTSKPSTSGTIIPKLARQALYFLYPKETRRFSHLHSHLHSLAPTQLVPTRLEGWFLESLASVGHCRKHRGSIPGSKHVTSHISGIPSKKDQSCKMSFCRHQRTKASSIDTEVNIGAEPNPTKEELMALVDQYDEEPFANQPPLLELPRLYQPSDGPHLTVSDKIEDEWPPPRFAWPASPDTKAQLKALDEALRDFYKDPEEIFRLYRKLPNPRAPYLESKTRHRLLRHLSIVESKNEHSMLRFFSVIDDMKGTAIPLTKSEWNSALSFAARYVARSTEIEVEACLHMWREMEHVAGVKGNGATFNALYDVACKAGKFTLAEMIYKEMAARGFNFTRYDHVSQIHCCGLKGDGDGVRAAYRSLVEAGEIVDTVVLNAVISALISANEPSAAENVYERMKKIHLERSNPILQPRNYKSRRKINSILMNMAKIAQVAPPKREQFQENSIVAPDAQTYRILINHSAIGAGALGKTSKFLEEMILFEVPLQGGLFLTLLKGFARHGGIRYTQWTEERLETLWKAFMQAIDEHPQDLHISRWMVVWALRAFAKCSGKARTLTIWEEVKERWEPEGADLDFALSSLQEILERKEDMSQQKHDWLLGANRNDYGF